MDKLWAPWRVKYVTRLDKKTKGCIFCKMLREKKDKKNYIFVRTKYAFTVLNIYPYNNGHVLVVPNRHVGDLAKLTREEKIDLMELLVTTQQLIDKALRPKGYNVGINIGRIAGAGYPGHLHIHVVPRWGGDVNFMPVVANTKVISQSLEVLFDRLQCVQEKKSKN